MNQRQSNQYVTKHGQNSSKFQMLSTILTCEKYIVYLVRTRKQPCRLKFSDIKVFFIALWFVNVFFSKLCYHSR